MEKFFVFFVAMIVLTSCVTVGGKNLDVSDIKKGISTRADAVSILGPPDQEITLGGGDTHCTWVSLREKRNLILGALMTKGIDDTNQERKNSVVGREIKTVRISFSPEGIVSEVATSKSGSVE